MGKSRRILKNRVRFLGWKQNPALSPVGKKRREIDGWSQADSDTGSRKRKCPDLPLSAGPTQDRHDQVEARGKS
jgi:hypothetical protein